MTSSRTIIIGSRGSDLALWQANHVKAQLEALGHQVQITVIKTQGDAIQHLSFDKLEGKGFFTKEIETVLLNKEVDLAVHSHKDLETDPPPGLMVAAVSDREDPSELLLIRPEAVDHRMQWNLKADALVGTSSARRKSIVRSFRPDVGLKDLRGNVPTRINKLRDGNYDAILLANAGVSRLELDLSDLHVVKLDPREFIPAPAQGVLALQIREGDEEMAAILAHLNDKQVADRIGVERTILNRFDGGCQLPLGAYCARTEAGLELWAAAADSWEKVPVRLHLKASTSEGLADKVVEALRSPAAHRVFVSRELKANSPFKRMLEAKGMTIHAQSLIETRTITIPEAPNADWYFFSSPSTVTHFLGQQEIPGNARIGAMGPGTASRLKEQGYEVAFTGNDTDPANVAKAFATAAAGTIVFPVGTKSLRSVPQAITAPNRAIELEVYESVLRPPETLPESDVLVFTSPSNVQAFLSTQSIPATASVVAMGTSTGKALEDAGVTSYALPWEASELALSDAIF